MTQSTIYKADIRDINKMVLDLQKKTQEVADNATTQDVRENAVRTIKVSHTCEMYECQEEAQSIRIRARFALVQGKKQNIIEAMQLCKRHKNSF